MKPVVSFTRTCLFTACVVLFSFLISTHAETNDSAVAVDFDMASSLLSAGSFLEAIDIYTDIKTNSPDMNIRARALFFTGSVYDHYLDQPGKALECYRTILDDYPETSSAPDALFNCGRTLYRDDRFDEAYKTFRRYLSLYPESIRRQSALAWAENAKKNRKTGSVSKTHHPVKRSLLSGTIRVRLASGSKRLIFNSPEPVTISDATTGKPFFSGTGPVILTRGPGTIRVNTINTIIKHCKVEGGNTPVSIGGKQYRGDFSIYSEPSGLTVINHVAIEDYLYGVVPKEMSWLWAEEALKAQAIASRTYALYIRDKQPRSKHYDLEATTASQVYGGVESEKLQTTKAVNDTCGLVMSYNNRMAVAYFHANSGGHTESASNVWGAELPYLKGTTDSFSSLQPDSDWEYSISYTDLKNLLRPSVQDIGNITRVTPGSRTASGRTTSLKIHTDTGIKTLRSNTFRILTGPTTLKSTLFDLFTDKKNVYFKGTGYGHGVGMSQWGAHRMAQAGYSYRSILEHYYHGIRIDRVSYK